MLVGITAGAPKGSENEKEVKEGEQYKLKEGEADVAGEQQDTNTNTDANANTNKMLPIQRVLDLSVGALSAQSHTRAHICAPISSKVRQPGSKRWNMH